jgi:hypothetical protein
VVNVCIHPDGTKFWILNNYWHRSNGPTVCWFDGDCEWWWYDLQVTEYEHMMLVGQERTNG